jgi:tetratricopeptide (TPR) repeat protein
MLRRLTNLVLAAGLLMFVTAVAVPQAAKEKQVKDQQEYDLINGAIAETDPAKKLQILDQWKEKYAESDYAEDRLRMYLASYQQTNQAPKAVETAKELLKMVPGDFSANYSIALLTPFLGSTSPQVFSDGEAAAKALLGGAIEKQFAPANKQAAVSQADWDNAKKQAVTSSHQTLGWIAMQKKDNTAAEEQFKKVLELNPSAGQVSYWLGDVVLKQGNPNKNELALFSFARAAVYEGPGALPPESRKQVADYLAKVYSKYAGTEEGLPEIKQMAKTRALPPADLKIESADVRAFNKEQQARKENPLLYTFIDLKANLTGANGEGIWADLNGKLTPQMQLYVVSADPPDRPQTIHLSSKQGGPVEVVLNLENRLREGVGSGRRIRFEGVAANISRQPFRLTLNDGKIL